MLDYHVKNKLVEENGFIGRKHERAGLPEYSDIKDDLCVFRRT